MPLFIVYDKSQRYFGTQHYPPLKWIYTESISSLARQLVHPSGSNPIAWSSSIFYYPGGDIVTYSQVTEHNCFPEEIHSLGLVPGLELPKMQKNCLGKCQTRRCAWLV